MSAATMRPSRHGSCRVLMLGTAVMTVAAAAVLAMGTQDARLLRLGLVVALWAALLGAFAAAQLRREARTSADHAEQLRSSYQLELEREVAARREHTLTVERELREQAELTQRREIGELRAELAAMRANLERLGGATPLVERVTLQAESTRWLPLPAQPREVDASPVPALVVPVARGRSSTCLGPDLVPAPNSASSREPGRHNLPVRGWADSYAGDTGPHTNGSSVLQPQESTPAAPSVQPQGQRTVDDLIAAHGGITAKPRRRRNHR